MNRSSFYVFMIEFQIGIGSHTHELSEIERILGEYGDDGVGGVLADPLTDNELAPCDN
jgi:hypothetical protein